MAVLHQAAHPTPDEPIEEGCANIPRSLHSHVPMWGQEGLSASASRVSLVFLPTLFIGINTGRLGAWWMQMI